MTSIRAFTSKFKDKEKIMDEQIVMAEENRPPEKKETPMAVRIVKIVAFSLILCFVMCAFLTWYLTSVSDTILELEEKGKMDNTIWLVKYASVLPPVIVCAILLTLFYKFGNSYIAVKTQRDKAIIMSVVFLFTYAVLLTLILQRSQGWYLPDVEPEEGEEIVKTLFDRSVIWFSVQLIPFFIAISYHLLRSSNEKKEMSEGYEEE